MRRQKICLKEIEEFGMNEQTTKKKQWKERKENMKERTDKR